MQMGQHPPGGICNFPEGQVTSSQSSGSHTCFPCAQMHMVHWRGDQAAPSYMIIPFTRHCPLPGRELHFINLETTFYNNYKGFPLKTQF